MDLRSELEHSRDFWRASAEHDKKQLKLSLAIGGLGVFCTGVSVIGIVAGAPLEGSVGVVLGGTMIGTAAESVRNELRDYTQMVRNTAQRELQISQLPPAEES